MVVLLLAKQERKDALHFFARALEMDMSKIEEVFEYAPALLQDAETLSLISTFKK